MFFWTIVLISTNITYIGQFEDEAKCNKAVEAIKTQYIKAACIQAKAPDKDQKK